MRSSRLLLTLVLSLILAAAVHAGEERDYAWLKLQDGITLFHSRQYGDAMIAFSECQRLKSQWPQVEFWIGRIYEVEGDNELAIKQYRKSLDYYRYTAPFSADHIYEVMLHLADVYRKTGKKDKDNNQLFKKTLEELLDSGSNTNEADRKEFYQSLLSAYERGGLNKVLELYRLKGSFEIEVYRRLSDYHILKEEWDEAHLNLMLGVLASLSTVIAEMERIDVNFLFTTDANAEESERQKLLPELSDNDQVREDLDMLTANIYSDLSLMLSDAARHDLIREYISQSRLMPNLYRMAEVMKFQADSLIEVSDENDLEENREKAVRIRQSAIDLLWICIRYPYDEKWSVNANRLFLEISTID